MARDSTKYGIVERFTLPITGYIPSTLLFVVTEGSLNPITSLILGI